MLERENERRGCRKGRVMLSPGEREKLCLTWGHPRVSIIIIIRFIVIGTASVASGVLQALAVPNGPKTVPKWVFGENRECKFPNSQSFARPAKRSRTHRPNFVRIKFRCRISNPPPTPPAVWLPRPDWNVNTCIRYVFPAFWCRAGTKTRTHGNRAHQTDL